MSDSFVDPTDKDEILNKLKELPTLGDVKKLVDEVFPGWFTGIIKRYSLDYPQLQKNWEDICNKNNVSPLEILLVRNIIWDDDNHILVKTFCELFTRSGFSVRRLGEYFPCEICDLALPNKNICELLQTPFKTTCQKCLK